MANSFFWGAAIVGAPLFVGLQGLLIIAGAGCGPSLDERQIKTADQRMQEQEQLAYEEELRKQNKPAAEGGPVEDPTNPASLTRSRPSSSSSEPLVPPKRVQTS